MKKDEKVATTVKIPAELYDELKVLGIRHKISLQTLVEKCVNLFVGNSQVSASFREVVITYTLPKVSSYDAHAELLKEHRQITTGSCEPTIG